MVHLPSLRSTLYLTALLTATTSLLAVPTPERLAVAENAKKAQTTKSGQFVRISVPKGGVLTLAEVEIISGGKNIAREGKATQSSVGSGGKPERAIDGNKSADWNKGGQTHTNEAQKKNPWWEIDLGKEAPIESIQIWNRDGFQERLANFKISVLNAKREPVFERENNAAPEGSAVITLKGKGTVNYLSQNGKAGKPFKAKKKSSGGSEALPTHEVPADYRDPANFAFQSGDVVALLGSGLAERMQYEGWMETLVQSHAKGQKLTFRNLGYSGDRPNSYPRNKGFTPPYAYLAHIKADVVLVFFGYNESFDNNPIDHTAKLNELVQHIRATKPNDKFPRIVLFSPIAHENLKTPNLPNGKASNKRLAAYTQATKAAAEASGVAFVDLFSPSQKLYAATAAPLTINGIHLNALGNRLVGEVIAQALTGQKLVAGEPLERVRAAVLEKNTKWFDRYRAVDGNDIWGGRSTLRFNGTQTNGDVLRHEMIMLDVLTANRDKLIWARAKGGDLKVNDDNVPKPIEVISNVGGKGNMSSAQKEGTVTYLPSEESRQKIAVPDDFKVEVFADEKQFPELVNPVQMQVGSKGRLWVAAWPTYPKQTPTRDVNDAILIFEDTDKDGRADKMIKFAEVPNPLGFEFWNGGVIVSSQPNLIFLRDNDGDDIADERYVIAHGIGSADTHHAANNLVYGPDGGIYWQSGVFLHNNIEHPWGSSLSTGSSAMYRFDPRRFTNTAASSASATKPARCKSLSKLQEPRWRSS